MTPHPGRPTRHLQRRALAISCSIAAILLGSQQAFAQDSPQAPTPTPAPAPAPGTPPPGFEDLDTDVDTLFDLYFLGRRVGVFRAVLSRGTLRFARPEEIATALDSVVDRTHLLELLSRPLDTNETFRCFSGQNVNCGLLPAGTYGIIADPQRFSVELFVDPTMIRQRPSQRLTLGPSSATGPSLVQNIAVAVTTDGFDTGQVDFGGTFDTAASWGETAFIAQTYIGTGFGSRLNQGHIQHIWGSRVGRAGLIEDFSTALLANYRMVGGEFGSFYPRLAYEETGSGSTIDIVLPRDADVEIRRNGMLLSVMRYRAGPQRLETSSLPEGSYPISIIARADGAVILDETRAFSRGSGLPIPGKTEFTLRAGIFVEDRFSLRQGREAFLPQLRETPVISARATRRIAPATALEANLLAVDGGNYGELSLRTYVGRIEGTISGAVGDDGSWGVAATGSAMIENIRFSLSARMVRTEDVFLASVPGRYQPFFRNEDSITASAQFPLLDGSFSMSGSYSKSGGLEERYNVNARYTRSVQLFGRPAFASIFGMAASNETRIGATVSVNFGLDRRTTVSASAGSEVLPNSEGSARGGYSPILNATVSRRDAWNETDVITQVGVGTSADSDRAFVGTTFQSPLGLADMNAQYVRNKTGSFTSIVGNAQTGFVIGGGKAKLGIARSGDAAILTDLDVGDSTNVKDEQHRKSGYRVRVNSQNLALLRPGGAIAAGVAAYDEYDVSLVPENAPPYEVKLDSRKVTLYPGNVVRLRYSAHREFTLFGQLVDKEDKPIDSAAVRAGNDFTRTDPSGYFTITAPSSESIEVRLMNGGTCRPVPIGSLVDVKAPRNLTRIGKLTCEEERGPSQVENGRAREALSEARAAVTAIPEAAQPTGN